MMVVKSNARAVAQAFRKIRKDLGNNSKPLKKLALMGKTLAIRLAPEKTGALKKGIFYRLLPNKMELVSMVRGRFKQNLWVNRSPPYTTISPWWNQYKPTTYGDGTHTITGTPMFFDLTFQKLAKESGRIFDVHVGKVLRAKG